MEYEIIRTPYLLYETVEMLYKFVNRTSYRALLSHRLSAEKSAEADRVVRQVEQLQAITGEVCQGLSPDDPALRRFFGKVEMADDQEGTCLAYFLTLSFLNLHQTDFRGSIEEIRREWHWLQTQGAWINGSSIKGLHFCRDREAPCDLLGQICALSLPPEFRMTLYGAFQNFDRTLDEMAALLYPIAQRLGETIHKADWIVDEMVRYWQQASDDPLNFFRTQLGWSLEEETPERIVLAVSAMNYNYVLNNSSNVHPRESCLYIGCGANMSQKYALQSVSYESLSMALKALGDKKRLEILDRLKKDRAYGHELAEAMDVDPSYMSRSLALLCNYGFLKQEREAQRNYYQTDLDVVRSILRQLERILLP